MGLQTQVALTDGLAGVAGLRLPASKFQKEAVDIHASIRP
jgi:hypothetical protein